MKRRGVELGYMMSWVSGLKAKPKALNENIKISLNSKHIDAYAQKGRKRHFGLN